MIYSLWIGSGFVSWHHGFDTVEPCQIRRFKEQKCNNFLLYVRLEGNHQFLPYWMQSLLQEYNQNLHLNIACEYFNES